MMCVLVHGRDNAADATGSLHPGCGVETTRHFLLDLLQRHCAFGHILVKGYTQYVPTGQYLGQALLWPMQQALACTLGLWPTRATAWKHPRVLFCYARLHCPPVTGYPPQST